MAASNGFIKSLSLRPFQRTIPASLPELLAWCFYALVITLTAVRHEPWADEAQAWLLARDANLFDLWTRYLRLEGTPGLWHSSLHLFIRMGLPYIGLNLVSVALGLAGAALLLRCGPLPLFVRIFLPFTYFLGYQYSVVARSYSLAPPLLFALALLFQKGRNRPVLITGLLVLLAMVSAQAILLSAVLALTFVIWKRRDWEQLSSDRRHLCIVCMVSYITALLLITLAVWPSTQATFVVTPNWSLANLAGISKYSFQQAFGEGYWPVIIVAFSIPLLSRGPGLLFFALSSASLCLFGALIYSNVWHHGFLVLAWLLAVWISSYQVSKPGWSALISLSIFVAIQCSWTCQAIRYDWGHPYSGAKAAAQYLKENHLSKAKIFGVGFPSVSLQPYFSSNLYSNYEGGGKLSFWMWSRQNRTNDEAERLGSERPEVVVLGYSSESDRKLWSHLIAQSGYTKAASFQGSTFWETGPFQPESFEIYRPAGLLRDTDFASTLNTFNAAAQAQFLWGVATPDQPGGFWVSSSFGTILQRPSTSGLTHPIQLRLLFQVNKDQIRQSGPMKLTAYVSGRRLPTILVKEAGLYQYRQDVQTQDLYWAVVPVSFQIDKSGLALSNIQGDHVALVSEVSLAAK